MYINRTVKCLKKLQKRSIDDNLRQLVLIRQDPTSSLQVILDFFFFLLFQKNGSVRRKETKHFTGMALSGFNNYIKSSGGKVYTWFVICKTVSKRVNLCTEIGLLVESRFLLQATYF